ncbi:MAG: hypothetical protein GWP06_00570 [Actinobacteria bacterium]|nr:hypothetical protein [Actinomycetota bacterium]
MKTITFRVLAIFTLVLLAVQFSFAQVSWETVTTSNGFFGQGAFKSFKQIYLQGNAQRTVSKMEFTGSIMKHFSPKGMDSEITRLDKELFWRFNDRKKTYTEATFAELKQMFEQGVSEYETPKNMPESRPQANEGESEYNWEKPKIEVRKLAGSQNINGFKCQPYVVTATTVGTHKATGIKDTLLIVSHVWSSKKAEQSMKAAKDFNKRLMEKLGFMRQGGRGFAMITGQYMEQLKELQKQVNKIDGYPIKTDMRMTMTSHVKKAKGGSETGSEGETPQVALDDLKSSLGSLFGRKMKKTAKKKSSGATEIFQSTSVIKSIKTGNINSKMFVVPVGYTLTK